MGHAVKHMGQAMMHMGRSMMNQAPGPMMGGTFGPPKAETLKQQIAITEDQEEAWTTYAKVLKDVIETKRSWFKSIDRTAMRNMSVEDRQAFMAGKQKQRQETHETLKTAATALLESLEDDQKTKAQKTLPGLTTFGPRQISRRGMGGYGGGMMGGGGGGMYGMGGMGGCGAGMQTGSAN